MKTTDSLVGKTIGNYRVLDVLGKGGMGVVYHGEHPEIESKVAIKVLLPHFVKDPVIVRRFIDEARAVNRIGHPGIVRIHDCRREEALGVYMIMELLEGQNLEERFKERAPLPLKRTIRWFLQAASVLDASHAAGIIHRDIKPSNLFVTPDPDVPGGERIKVLDFGIAKLTEDHGPGDGTTKTGSVFGSPMFMSPEQCIDSKDVDHHADIFSLAASAYWALTGCFPYDAGSLGKLVLMHQSETPDPPGELRLEIPGELDRVLLRALSRDPEERQESMADLRADLATVLDTLPDEEDESPGTARPPVPRDDDGPGDTTDVDAQPPRMTGANKRVPEEALEEPVTGPGHREGDASEGSRPKTTTFSSSTGQLTSEPGAPARRGIAGVAAVLLVAGALVAWLSLENSSGNQPPRPAPAVAARPAPAVAARPAPAVAVRTTSPPQPVEAPATKASPAKAPPAQADAGLTTIRLQLSPAAARVTLDGEATRSPLQLQPGSTHRLRVSAPGHATHEQVITVEGDRTLKVTLKKHRRKVHTRPAVSAPPRAGPPPATPKKVDRPLVDEL